MVQIVVLTQAGVATAPEKQIRLADAVQALLTAKKQSGLRPTYLRSLRLYLSAFSRGREDTPIDEIDENDIEGWFMSRTEAPSSRASNLGRIASLFSYARRRRWVAENPCDRVERVRVDLRAPRVLTVEQAETLLRFCERRKPVALAYVTLAMLAGIRPDEIARIGWDVVNLDAGTVRIDAAASKVHKRRVVTLSENAVEWLRLARDRGATLPVSRITRVRYLHEFRVLLDLPEWPQDCLRHTCASMMLVRDRDAGKVALQLGNSARILLSHYQELVEAEDAERFWSLTPVGADVSHRGHDTGGTTDGGAVSLPSLQRGADV